MIPGADPHHSEIHNTIIFKVAGAHPICPSDYDDVFPRTTARDAATEDRILVIIFLFFSLIQRFCTPIFSISSHSLVHRHKYTQTHTRTHAHKSLSLSLSLPRKHFVFPVCPLVVSSSSSYSRTHTRTHTRARNARINKSSLSYTTMRSFGRLKSHILYTCVYARARTSAPLYDLNDYVPGSPGLIRKLRLAINVIHMLIAELVNSIARVRARSCPVHTPQPPTRTWQFSLHVYTMRRLYYIIYGRHLRHSIQ